MVARGELKEHISTILAKEVGNLDDLSAKKVREGVEAAMGLEASGTPSEQAAKLGKAIKSRPASGELSFIDRVTMIAERTDLTNLMPNLAAVLKEASALKGLEARGSLPEQAQELEMRATQARAAQAQSSNVARMSIGSIDARRAMCKAVQESLQWLCCSLCLELCSLLARPRASLQT